MRDAAVIEVENLTKRYGSVTAVDSVSFSVREGEVFGFLGPNGAGKTTTISILSCLVRPTSGTARICGVDVVRNSLAARSKIGVVPQEIALYGTLSARDNLVFWGRMYGLPDRVLMPRVDELLEVVGLTERSGGRVDTFSGGMKRRINIAIGLLHRPTVLFLDEPTVGIDPQTRRSILELVRTLNEEGLTILYTTHYLEGAEFLCDRIGIMDVGRLIAVGTKRELIESIGATDLVRISAKGLTTSLVSEIEELEPVERLTHTDDRVVVNAMSGSNLLPVVVDVLTRGGATVVSADVTEPNLESVFLHMTGKFLEEPEGGTESDAQA